MQTIKNAVIAAAGMGKRLGFDMPKPLIKIHEKTLIEYQLDLLQEIENIYVIVGFRAEEMINHINSIRKDVIFVMNHDYAHTSTLFSLQLALRYIKGPYIFLDGDIYLHKKEFLSFLEKASASSEDIIGITKTKSEDSVFVEMNDKGQVIDFTRKIKHEHEWLGLGYFKNVLFSSNEKLADVFSQLYKYLPLNSFVFDAYEIDTPKDLELAERYIT
ncbi:MAG: NTP transferase domain-containing protein [Pseudomonadota bacterium]|jgi:choline kinase|nr:NTP transferase domain-containing protein [Alphaproteobacteria bacterium]